MSSFVSHFLILWAVVAAVLASVAIAGRLGLQFGKLSNGGAFAFVAAAFGVVLGMTTFFASEHYSDLRETAENEATELGNFEAMTLSFPAREGNEIRSQLYCAVTEVIEQEWPGMTAEESSGEEIVEARQRAIYLALLRVGRGDPDPPSWFFEATEWVLEAAQDRQQRLLLSQPQIPTLLWVLIYVGAALMILFTFFFHLESRRQLLGMLAAVVVMLTAVIGVLAGLDTPTEEPFGLEPHALEAERELLATDVQPPPTDPASFCEALPTPSPEHLQEPHASEKGPA